MKSKDDGKRKDGRNDELRILSDALMRKPERDGSVDAMGLESRRRAVAYGRARGNA